MLKAVHPGLRHGLNALNWPHVVRLAEVVPSVDLDEVDDAPVRDERFPALCEQPVVTAVDEVLVVRVWTVVLETREVSGGKRGQGAGNAQ